MQCGWGVEHANFQLSESYKRQATKFMLCNSIGIVARSADLAENRLAGTDGHRVHLAD